MHVGLLFGVDFLFIDETDTLFAQAGCHVFDGFLVFFRVDVVQLVDGFQQGAGFLVFLAGIFVVVFGDAADAGHADAEKLVEVVGVDAEERKAFEQGDGFFLCLLENAVVEVHPTHITVKVFHVLVHGKGCCGYGAKVGVSCDDSVTFCL